MKFRKIFTLLALLISVSSIGAISAYKGENSLNKEETRLVLKKEKASLITYADNDTSLSIIVILWMLNIAFGVKNSIRQHHPVGLCYFLREKAIFT